jgi:hypothetical protein
MTEPMPANALDDLRTLLHGELEATLARVGWGGRADAYPPATIRTPGAWVDVATVSSQGQGAIATFPLVLAVDGTDADQVRRLDALLAIVWERLLALKVPADAPRLPRGALLQLLTGGPDDLDLGGINTRALSITVQCPIAPRTLCPTALTASDDLGDNP